MFMYLADVVERRRQEPGDDLISRLVAGADPDDPDSLSPIEITLFAVLLLVAGNETTTNLLGNGAAAFAAHPDPATIGRPQCRDRVCQNVTILGVAVSLKTKTKSHR